MPANMGNSGDSPLLQIVRQAGDTATPAPLPPRVVAQLVVGAEAWTGTWWGYAQRYGDIVPLQELRLPGAGLHRLTALATQPALPYAPLGSAERWSRTVGALGGVPVWQRLGRLTVAVIGCGRSGSLIAEALTRLGVAKLLLIDADRVELHNVGEMALVTPDDVGKPKPLALAAHLANVSSTVIIPKTTSVNDPDTRAAAARADLLVSTVDNDHARLSVAVLATLYQRVLLDIGTGIHGANAARTMGADVRLIVPGDGCLRCCGSVTDDVAALRGPSARDWRQERTGSLASLNHMAGAGGVRLLEDLAAARVTSSRWVRMQFDPAGELTVHRPRWSTEPGCPLCARSGQGDATFAPFA